nr:reverse transcriptase domain-containing protein [Tanacetum cinerariifolium]
SIKVNGVTDDALRLYRFPHSLTHHATAWFGRLPRNSINTFEQMAKMILGKYFPTSMVTKLRNEITNFRQHPDESLFKGWECYKLLIDRCPNYNMLWNLHERRPKECYDIIENMTGHHNDWDTSAQWSESSSSITSSSNTKIATLKAKMAEINKNLMRVVQVNQQVKAVTPNCETCGGPHSYIGCPATVGQTQNVYAAVAYQGNTVTNPKEELKGITTPSRTAYQGPMIPTTSSSLRKVVERETDAPKPNPKPSNPYLSRIHDQKLRDKANDQKEKFFQIFQDLNFNISFADALILMPKFSPTIQILLTNKDKLSELARTLLNEHCLVVLLKKLPEKLGDPDKVAEDVFVKVGTFHFPADFVVVDFNANHRVPLILERSFLKIERDLIDVFEGELTLRVGKEAITFNLDQTSRYSTNYNDITSNRIDVIDMACEEYSQEVLGFSDVIASGNPTYYYDLIVSTSSLTLNPFGDSDFLFEEVDAFLALEDDPTSPKVDQSYFDHEGNILLLEAFLNDDPSLPSPNQGNYLPQDLPPHLEYAFLEDDDKFPIIIVKDLSNKEKTALITVLKSHKRAIAWKLSDIKEKMLKRCEDTNLCLNLDKSHFMVKEGIVLSHKISKNRIEVDKGKVDVIAKLPHPIAVKGAVLGQHQEKHFRPIHYASETTTEAELNYTIMEKEMLAMVYAFEKFWSYLIMNKSIVYTDHSALKYHFAKKDSKARLLYWILLLQEFTFKVIDIKGAENLGVDHLS